MDTDEPPRLVLTNQRPLFSQVTNHRPPEITTRPRSVRVAEGGIIEMTCVAEGAPYPAITWWNNNRIVSPNSRMSVSNTGQHLRIQDIELYDAGEYRCTAENSVGRRTETATITVISDGNILPPGYSGFSDFSRQIGFTTAATTTARSRTTATPIV